MLLQYVARSGAPGNTQAIPMMATSLMAGPESSRCASGRTAHEDHIRIVVLAALEFIEECLDAEFRVDDADTPPPVLVDELGGDHAAAAPRAPVDREHSAARLLIHLDGQ